MLVLPLEVLDLQILGVLVNLGRLRLLTKEHLVLVERSLSGILLLDNRRLWSWHLRLGDLDLLDVGALRLLGAGGTRSLLEHRRPTL